MGLAVVPGRLLCRYFSRLLTLPAHLITGHAVALGRLCGMAVRMPQVACTKGMQGRPATFPRATPTMLQRRSSARHLPCNIESARRAAAGCAPTGVHHGLTAWPSPLARPAAATAASLAAAQSLALWVLPKASFCSCCTCYTCCTCSTCCTCCTCCTCSTCSTCCTCCACVDFGVSSEARPISGICDSCCCGRCSCC